MALYTFTSKNDFGKLNRLPSQDELQLYNAIGRNSGDNAGSNDNFFTKRAKSIENALGTTGAAIASKIYDDSENAKTTNLLKDNKTRMNDVAKKYGFNTYQDVWDARDKAEREGDTKTLEFIDNIINPELQGQANANANLAKEKADAYNDYRKNNYVSKKINQDEGKFLGSAINTLSTATDVLGLTTNPLGNAIQGGIEGIADELEQSGLKNFDWQRAGQNALTGAVTGAVTGKLNQGMSNALAKNGGNLFKGGNAVTRTLNNLGSNTVLGRGVSTLASGAARGAVSGAVGGATGAGLQSAMQGASVGEGISNALQGAVSGAKQGAVTGAIMTPVNNALNRTKLIQDVNQAKQDWQNSGENFGNRLRNTWDESNTKQLAGKVADFVENHPLGLSVKKVNGSQAENDQLLDGLSSEEWMKEMFPLRASTAPEDNTWKGDPMAKTAEQEIADITQRNIKRLDQMDSSNDISWDLADDIQKGRISPTYADDPLYNYLYNIAKQQGVKVETEDADGYTNNDAVEIDYSVLTPQQRAEIARLAQNSKFLYTDNDIPALEDETAISPNQLRLIDQVKNQNRISTPEGYTAEDLIRMANSQKQQFVDDVRAITAENNGIPNEAFFDTAVKTNVERINQKIKEKGRMPTDMLRSTIMVKDPNSSLDSIIKSFEDRGYKIWNNDITNRYTDGSTGYKDIALKFVKGNNDNIVKEIQIMTPNMQEAKYVLGGHELYEKVRVKEPGWEDYEAKMNQLYAMAERADAAALNSSADTSRPSLRALSGGNSTPEEVYPATSSPSRTTLTGVPSTMKYLGNSFDAIDGSPFDSSIAQNREKINTPETELYRKITGQEEQPFTSYGESGLATGRTKKQNIVSKAGRAMEAAQANATRKEARDIGIDNAGELINKVRKRSGFTDLEKQAAFAKELTGGENSLLDSVQRNAISATEDGTPRTVNLDSVAAQVNKLIDDLPNTLVKPSKKEEVRSAVLADLTNGGIDTITKANNFKAAASQQFLINEKTPNDSAKALGVFYTKVGDLVDDASYVEIPKTQVEAMFETAESEARARAKVAQNNGKNDVAKAYNNLADELNSSDKTMRAYRSLKKDYVDINKLNKKTQQGATAWNNNPLVMGTAITTAMATGNPLIAVPSAWLAKTIAPAIGQVAIDTSAKVGGKLADWGDAISTGSTGQKTTAPTVAVNTDYSPSTQLYNAIGRTEGAINRDQARVANYLVDAVQEDNANTNAGANTLESLITPTTTGSTGVYDSIYGSSTTATPTTTQSTSTQSSYFQPTGDYWTDILAKAMTSAIDADDVEAFASLYGMYQDSLANLQKAQTSSATQTKLTDKQRQANAAARALEDFENTESNFGYDVSNIPILGTIANIGGNEYASKAEALALQIGYMLSGATVNKDEALKIGKAYVPQPRDSEAVRQSKINQLRGIISDYQQTYEA